MLEEHKCLPPGISRGPPLLVLMFKLVVDSCCCTSHRSHQFDNPINSSSPAREENMSQQDRQRQASSSAPGSQGPGSEALMQDSQLPRLQVHHANITTHLVNRKKSETFMPAGAKLLHFRLEGPPVSVIPFPVRSARPPVQCPFPAAFACSSKCTFSFNFIYPCASTKLIAIVPRHCNIYPTHTQH